VSRSGWAISDTADTIIYLYYDIGHVDNTDYVGDTNSTPAENVWDANFKGVYHMADGADNEHIYDSTGNSRDGTKTNPNEPNEIAGLIGEEQEFDGSDDKIATTIPAGDVDDLLTIEALIKGTGITKGTFSITGSTGSPHVAVNWANQGIILLGGSNYKYFKHEPVDPDDGNLHYVVWIMTGNAQADINNAQMWADGQQLTTSSITPTGAPLGRGGIRIGVGGGIYYPGTIDEVRISDIVRLPAWIKATNESLWDDLLDFGSEERVIGPFPTHLRVS